jgi:hypothetical protein
MEKKGLIELGIMCKPLAIILLIAGFSFSIVEKSNALLPDCPKSRNNCFR